MKITLDNQNIFIYEHIEGLLTVLFLSLTLPSTIRENNQQKMSDMFTRFNCNHNLFRNIE
jgi:hypothetical protein